MVLWAKWGQSESWDRKHFSGCSLECVWQTGYVAVYQGRLHVNQYIACILLLWERSCTWTYRVHACSCLCRCQLAGQNSTIYFYFALSELLGEKFLRHLENKLLSFMLKYFLPVCPSCPVPQVLHMFGIDWSCVPGTCAKCLHVLLLLILSRVYEVCIIKFILQMWTVRFSCGSSFYGRMRTNVPTQISNVGRPTCSLTSTEPLPREVMGNSAGPRQPVWTTSTSHFLEAECRHQSGELLLPTLSSSSCLSRVCPKAPGTRRH